VRKLSAHVPAGACCSGVVARGLPALEGDVRGPVHAPAAQAPEGRSQGAAPVLFCAHATAQVQLPRQLQLRRSIVRACPAPPCPPTPAVRRTGKSDAFVLAHTLSCNMPGRSVASLVVSNCQEHLAVLCSSQVGWGGVGWLGAPQTGAACQPWVGFGGGSEALGGASST